jgi:hypothetical protein
MALFGKKARSVAKGATAGPVDHSLPDDQWISESRARYDATVNGFYGTPDTMASGGHDRYANQDFGTALFFFAKSIDMLQTQYGYSEMASRQPSVDDDAIINGFVSSLGASLSMHPTADVSEPAQEARNYLNSICGLVSAAGYSEALYARGRDEIDRILSSR